MRALTIRQPWASFIALGMKEFETRGRATSIRGPVAIHAGAAQPLTDRRIPRLTIGGLISERLGREPSEWVLHGAAVKGRVPLPLAAVVATANLVDCIPTADWTVTDREWALGDWTPGRFAWQLADVTPLQPVVPAKGKQGWWEWTPPQMDTAQAIVEVLSGVRIRWDNEDGLQAAVAEVLQLAGFTPQREVILSPKNRIDLLVGRVGVECKIGRQAHAESSARVAAQIARYAYHHEVIDEFVLVTTTARHRDVPSKVHPIPVRVVVVGGLG